MMHRRLDQGRMEGNQMDVQPQKMEIEGPKKIKLPNGVGLETFQNHGNIQNELAEPQDKKKPTNIFRDRTNLPEKKQSTKEIQEKNTQGCFPPNIDCTETELEKDVSELQTLIQDELPNKRVEQCVEDLQAEIFDFCMRTEVVLPLTEIKNLCKSNYFQCLQKDINEKMRAILIDWLVDVHSKFKMNHQTLFLAVNLIDRYLEQIVVPRTQLQLVGISSLFIASKYEEIYPPDLKDFVKCCDNTYTAEQILEVESQIISILNFNLVFTSAYQFFELFSQKRQGFSMGIYLLYLSTLEFLMAKYRPSIVAMAAIYLANKFLKLEMWHHDLPSVIGSSEKEIKDCALDLFLLVQKAKKSSLSAVPRKFSAPKHFFVSQIQIRV